MVWRSGANLWSTGRPRLVHHHLRHRFGPLRCQSEHDDAHRQSVCSGSRLRWDSESKRDHHCRPGCVFFVSFLSRFDLTNEFFLHRSTPQGKRDLPRLSRSDMGDRIRFGYVLVLRPLPSLLQRQAHSRTRRLLGNRQVLPSAVPSLSMQRGDGFFT